MRILLLHQAYATPRQPGGTRHHELARRLVDRGHEVRVIASRVSYLSGRADDAPRSEQVDGVAVERAWSPRRYHQSFLARAVSYAGFAASSLLLALRRGDVDVVWGTSPPLPQAAAAAIVARVRGRPFALEIRDLWPDFAIAMGVLRNPVAIRAARSLERRVVRAADVIVVNSPGFLPHLEALGVPATRVHVVANGVETRAFEGVEPDAALRRELFGERAFGVLYAGALGPANGLDVALDAAARCRDRPDVGFALVGDGKDRSRLEARVRELGLDNVRILPARPKDDMPRVLACADACLATLKPVAGFETVYPNKVFDYMAAARPVLLGIDGEIRRVVESAAAGAFFPPGSPDGLVEAIEKYRSAPALAREHGANGRATVARSFDRAKQAERLEEALAQAHARRARRRRPYSRAVKRAFDVLASGLGLLVASPAMLLAALAIRASMGKPVLFRQARGGRDGRVFTMYKFRSMRDARDATGAELPDAERLTPVGKLLRKTSIDELPALLNVLKGDMSIVGPRPFLAEYLPKYSPEEMRRHDVTPGLTGWAIVNGRNRLGWAERLAHDLHYVDHWSLAFDARILARTAWLVLRRSGVEAEGHVTSPRLDEER